MPAKEKTGVDYSSTLNLPHTDFPMKGDLPQREPQMLERWQGLYEKIQKHQEKRRSSYVLHDGPPYANGHIHIGHALNKTLKDMVVKSRALMGHKTPYVPGWDCHGLPIETALLKELKISKRGVTDIPAFRKQAEAFAERFIGLQREEFKRLGVLGDWDKPYKTMAREYEARILRAFRLLLGKGYIYRGLKPVLWCVTCETALAEAEVEYKDKTSPSVYVAFPVKASPVKELEGANVLIWTTTPWTLPANRAVAFHPDLEYVLADLAGRKLVLAKARVEAVAQELGSAHHVMSTFRGKELEGLTYERPYGGEGRGVLAAYVTAEDGTGVVHTAPGHGADDFFTGQKYDLEVANPVDASGRYTEKVGDPELVGKEILKEGNPAIVQQLTSRGWMLKKTDIQHSYPHCWRCKNPVVFRATEQWFLSVSHDSLRDQLLTAIGAVKWFPAEGANRIGAMVSGRPDWCLSRQRVWGTPIPVLFCSGCGKAETDDKVLLAIEQEVAKNGDGFWFERWGEPVTRELWPFLPEGLKCSGCGGATFHRERDILDVWMDSGASWLSVLEPRGQAPCELYLEGSDQHRGWFQSSLVLSVAITGSAPYKNVLTHGFVLDEKGHAMHKSAGNVVAPQEVIKDLGADVLRLWVALADYSDDVRISKNLLKGPTDSYLKFRNTVRYLLANTSDFDPSKDAVPADKMPELERFMLHKLGRLQAETLLDYDGFAFRAAARRLLDFCSFDLSSFYLDILKDRLYTAPKADPARRAAQTVMAETLRRLLLLASPIVSFTADEAWQHNPRRWGWGESPFLADLPSAEGLEDNALAARWQQVLELREKANKALEQLRADKKIGKPLDAQAVVSGPDWVQKFPQWAEVLNVSVALTRPGGEAAVAVEPASGTKCPRCWRRQPDVGRDAAHPEVCGRCAGQLAAL
jgi:isoleucyl-tRNA synthetase